MLFHSLRTRVVEWHRLRRDIRRLGDFDNRLLADIGIPRREIAACLKGERCE